VDFRTTKNSHFYNWKNYGSHQTFQSTQTTKEKAQLVASVPTMFNERRSSFQRKTISYLHYKDQKLICRNQVFTKKLSEGKRKFKQNNKRSTVETG
jgi:hypothetical protein